MSAREVFDTYWPDYCQVDDAECQPCEGIAKVRVRVPDAIQEVYLCEAHFGRHFKHLPKAAVDFLR